MTGPEHYLHAEHILALADQEQNAANPWLPHSLAAAQAHAILALAAAIADPTAQANSAWSAVTR